MTSNTARFFVAILSFFATSLAYGETSQRTFALPENGRLLMMVPTEWKSEVQQPANQTPPTIAIAPKDGPAFEILISVIPTASQNADILSDASMHAKVAAAAQAALTQSVERDLPLKEIKGSSAHGFFFTATDRAPNPGEFKFLTQGMLRAGTLALLFTILSNDGQEPVVKTALEMLGSAGQ
jgi:hypothetical protein